jgi:hypothetical protein
MLVEGSRAMPAYPVSWIPFPSGASRLRPGMTAVAELLQERPPRPHGSSE